MRLHLLGLVGLMLISCSMPVSSNPSTAKPFTQAVPAANQSAQIAGEDPSPQSQPIKAGQFVGAEHPTQGSARLVKKGNAFFLEFAPSFKTSQGPDLVVALHRSANVLGSTTPPDYPLKAKDYVVLAPLKKVMGAQTYSIPQNVQIEDFKSVVVWCRKFNATFGVAKFDR
jgi:hypothetical protein